LIAFKTRGQPKTVLKTSSRFCCMSSRDSFLASRKVTSSMICDSADIDKASGKTRRISKGSRARTSQGRPTSLTKQLANSPRSAYSACDLCGCSLQICNMLLELKMPSKQLGYVSPFVSSELAILKYSRDVHDSQRRSSDEQQSRSSIAFRSLG
jgi:hypothetical protein